jgi:hypothetical protein
VRPLPGGASRAKDVAGTVEHWNLPDAHHTHAIREHPQEYEQRVVGFFNEALL